MKAMDNPERNELITRALRGELLAAEREEFDRRLQQDPAWRSACDEENALNLLLRRLPNVPVSTNFTSLVLQEVRREGPRTGPPQTRFGFRFVRVAASFATVILAGFLGLQHYRKAERAEMAETVGAFTEVASVIASERTPPEMLFRDFDAIQQLSLPSESELDLELLLAMQK